MTKDQFYSKFPDEEAAIDYFIKIRYPDGLICPQCGARDKVYHYRNRPKVCHCKNCNSNFSVFKGTIFEKSSTKLLDWFDAICMFLNARKGISSLQLQRELGVTPKTAWRMEQQIRLAMEDEEGRKAFSGAVEVDETYVGGKPQRYPKSRSTGLYLPKTKKKRGRGTDHPVMMGLKERESGNVHAQIMPYEPSVKGRDKRLSDPQLSAVIDEECEKGATVISDDFKGYRELDKEERVQLWLLDDEEPPPRYEHHTVNHKAKRFTAGLTKDGEVVHTNGIESHWALIKRGFRGTYHSISEKYLPRYLDEFSFRQNTRRKPSLEVFDLLIKRSVLKL